MPLLTVRGAAAPRRLPVVQEDTPATIRSQTNTQPSWPGRAAGARRTGILATCANPQCRSGWLHVWRSSETAVFEGGWCCSEGCTVAQVQAALAREMDGWGKARENHRHRIPLGLVMLEQGWITQQALRAALAAQKAAGTGKLGRWLVRQKGASQELVTRALGMQWSCPVLDLESHNPEGLAPVMPRLFVDAFGALPLRVAAGRILYLGFEDRLDTALALAMERIAGLRVECGLVEEIGFRAAHARMLEARFPPVELIEAATETALAAALSKAVERARPVETRLARVHDCVWMRMWLRLQSGPLPEPGTIRDVIGSAGLR